MSIFFNILKIIGILFFILLLLMMLVFFHPIFYCVDSKIEKDISVKGYIWSFFQIVRIEFDITKSAQKVILRICGVSKQLYSGQEAETGEDETEDREFVEPAGSNISRQNTAAPKNSDKKTQTLTANQSKESDYKKEDKFPNKFIFLGKLIKREVSDERNRLALSHIWREILYLFGHLKPKYVKGEVSFSAGDPALTGQIIGAMSLLPVIYKYDMHIYPDFQAEKFYIAGNMCIKGRVTLFHMTCILIRLIQDRNIRRMLNKIRK